MARRQGSSGEEPRFRRAPVLPSGEFEDLGRRLIVLDGVAEFLEVDAHTCLRDRARAADVAPARLFTARLRGIAPRRRRAGCAFFEHPGVSGGGSGSCAVVFDADRKLQSEGIVTRFLACNCAPAASLTLLPFSAELAHRHTRIHFQLVALGSEGSPKAVSELRSK